MNNVRTMKNDMAQAQNKIVSSTSKSALVFPTQNKKTKKLTLEEAPWLNLSEKLTRVEATAISEEGNRALAEAVTEEIIKKNQNLKEAVIAPLKSAEEAPKQETSGETKKMDEKAQINHGVVARLEDEEKRGKVQTNNEAGMSHEILTASERARTATKKMAEEIIQGQEQVLKEVAKEASKIVSEKERVRSEVVSIFEDGKKALSEISKNIQKEEIARAEALKFYSIQKRKDAEARADEAEEVAVKERAEAEEARKNAERELLEAETAAATAIRERTKAKEAAELEAQESQKADKQVEAAVSASVQEIDLIQKKVQETAEEVILTQKNAREADALEVAHITTNDDLAKRKSTVGGERT